MRRALRWIGTGLLWLVTIVCLALAIVPHFLDARYYRGPLSDHFDGERFFNPDGEDDVLPAGGNRAGFFWRYLLSDDRPPWPTRVAVVPARPPARVTGETMLVTWIGHSSVLVQTAGLNILTDPVWSDTVGPFGIGARRVAPPGVRFADLPRIDLVLVSHDHYDHMDLATLKRLWDRDRPMIVTSLGNDSVMRQAGIPSRALDWNGRLYLVDGQLRDQDAWFDCAAPGNCHSPSIVVNRAHHWDSRWFVDRNRALWSSFVVTLPSGGNLFFAGDTGAGDRQWADAAARYGPIRLALIPIGAFRFAPGQMAAGSHIGPVDAVDAFRRLGAARAIGVHWGTFRLSYEAYGTPPRLLAAAEACIGQRGFGVAAIGRTVAVPVYAPPPPRPAMPRAALLACLAAHGANTLR